MHVYNKIPSIAATMDASRAAGDDADRDPWVTWRRGVGYTFSKLSELKNIIAERPRQRAHIKHVVVGEDFKGLIAFLEKERSDRSSLFRNLGPLPTFDFYPLIEEQVSMIIHHQQIFRDRSPLGVCCNITQQCVKEYELSLVGERFSHPEMALFFPDVLRKECSFIDHLEHHKALLVAHARMLIYMQEHTEFLERRHGRVNNPTIAEAFAGVLGRNYPSLYVQYVAPMFPDIVYGRRVKIPSVIEE